MKLVLLDDEHGHDKDGELWVCVDGRWGCASDPPPDAPLIRVKSLAVSWALRDGATSVLHLDHDGYVQLYVDGKLVRGPWSVLVHAGARTRYIDFNA